MITIIGAGRVGSNTAMKIACANIDDVLLLDITKGIAHGEALDISHACSSDKCIKGTHDFSDIEGSEIVINTAGIARKPGMTRLNLMKENKRITESIGENIKKYAGDCVVIQVANPLDLMTYVMLKTTGFPEEKVIGMGSMLDSLRFRYLISREMGRLPRDVNAIVIGEHGDSMVPVVSCSTVNGKPLKEVLSPEKLVRIVEETKKSGGEVISLKGSTFHGPSTAITIMAESVANNAKMIAPASVMLNGQYEISGICIGVPVKLGKSGAENILEIGLDDKELSLLRNSADILREKIRELEHEAEQVQEI